MTWFFSQLAFYFFGCAELPLAKVSFRFPLASVPQSPVLE